MSRVSIPHSVSASAKGYGWQKDAGYPESAAFANSHLRLDAFGAGLCNPLIDKSRRAFKISSG